jgi:hypothetical protein
MLATVVDTDALLQTIAAAFVAGVGVTFVFSLAILGIARSAEATRAGRSAEAALFVALAVVGLVATGAAAVFGVIVMTGK